MSDYVIETRGLTKTYGEQNSVSNLSIHVRKGRIYGLLGRNGAGKTTTMRMLLGLTAPSSGDVKIFGKPLRGNEKNILPRIGSLIESPGFYPNLTGTENLRIFADLRGLKSPKYIKGALEVVNLPYRDKKLFSQYSLGMKQRLAIALAVMHNPELLILDGRRSPCLPMTSESLTTAYCWKKKALRSWKQRTGNISALLFPMRRWLLTCFRANLAFRISRWTVPMS